MTDELPPDWKELLKQVQEMTKLPKLSVPSIAALDVPQVVLPQKWMDDVARLTEQMKSAALNLTSPIERWRVQLPRIPTLPPDVLARLTELGRAAAEGWRRGMPRNWDGFSVDEIEAAIDRVRSTGYSLAWVPRIEVLRDVLAAPAEDTGPILLGHAEAVIVDMNDCLAEITAEDYLLERDAALAAVAAFADGHSDAAQALASSTFTSAIHVAFEDRKVGRIENPSSARRRWIRAFRRPGLAWLSRFDASALGIV